MALDLSTRPDADRLAHLLAEVSRGDRAAFRSLYDATSPKLFAIVLRMLRDEGRAEDVLQDSFVSVWKNAGTYDVRRAAPMTWMITIVRNRALDELRRHDASTIELDEDLEATLVSDAVQPVDAVVGLVDAVALKRCLNQLEGGQRQAIAFAYFQGLTHSELAATMRVPMGTVKTWIRRGVDKLRLCLEGSGSR